MYRYTQTKLINVPWARCPVIQIAMTQKVVFRSGTEFNNFVEFQQRLKLYEKQEKVNFCISSSNKLKTTVDIDERAVENIKYKHARFACKFGGNSRSSMADEERKRQSKTYRQACPANFTIGSAKRHGELILRIIQLNEQHNHETSDTLFKALPKQRRETIHAAEPYLQQVIPLKPNMQLLQNQISVNDSDKGSVKRQDLYNLRRRMNETPIDANDLEKMIDEMKSVDGKRLNIRKTYMQ